MGPVAKILLTAIIAVSFQLKLFYRPLSHAGGATAADSVATALLGVWLVVEAKVSSEGVQAHINNDPEFMKKRLTLSRKEIRFLDQTCREPKYAASNELADAWFRKTLGGSVRDFGLTLNPKAPVQLLRISCRTGGIGPEAVGNSTFVIISKDQIGLNYFDNVFLLLRREKSTLRPR